MCTMRAGTRRCSVRSRPASSLSEIDPAVAEFSGSMISLDDPRHLRLRSIVNRAFTPKMVARIEESVLPGRSNW